MDLIYCENMKGHASDLGLLCLFNASPKCNEYNGGGI